MSAVLSTCIPASAQSRDVLQGLRGALDALGQAQQQRGGNGISHPDIGRSSGRDALIPPTPGIFPTKQALLDAVRRGELLDIRRASEEDRSRVADAVYAILVNEDHVPPIRESCRQNFQSHVSRLLFDNSYMWSRSLNNKPPEFFASAPEYSEAFKRSYAEVEYSWSRSDSSCDNQVMGRWVPHPYKEALRSLLNLYNKANTAYVQDEVTRRQGIYAAEVERTQQAAAATREQAAREQAAQRAAAQQRIDAEAARIRAQEQQRAEKERSRIGG